LPQPLAVKRLPASTATLGGARDYRPRHCAGGRQPL